MESTEEYKLSHIWKVTQVLQSRKLKQYFSKYQLNSIPLRENAVQRIIKCNFCYETNVNLIKVKILSRKQLQSLNCKNVSIKNVQKFISLFCYTCKKTNYIPIHESKHNAKYIEKALMSNICPSKPNTRDLDISSPIYGRKVTKSKNKTVSKLQKRLSVNNEKEKNVQGASLSDFLLL